MEMTNAGGEKKGQKGKTMTSGLTTASCTYFYM
jgi:hypothetical protein